ncbi:conserved hypothetical protein, partial [Ricinus communis]
MAFPRPETERSALTAASRAPSEARSPEGIRRLRRHSSAAAQVELVRADVRRSRFPHPRLPMAPRGAGLRPVHGPVPPPGRGRGLCPGRL